MTLIGSEFAQKVPPTEMSEFATECGYFLARSGDKALDTLSKSVEKNSQSLRIGSQPLHAKRGPDSHGFHVHPPACRTERELRTVLREQ